MKKQTIFIVFLFAILLLVIIFLVFMLLNEKNNKYDNSSNDIINKDNVVDLAENSDTASSTLVENKISDKNSGIVQEKIIYIEKPIYKESNELNDVAVQSSTDNISLSSERGVKIAYSYISQGKFDDMYTGEYGSILLGLVISTDNDIYIPQTTTDSSGQEIGFTYTIDGGFVGERNSDVKCSLKSDGYCKIKAGSTDKQISVNVWIYPEKPGEYAANFKKLGYKYTPKGTMNYIDINKIGEPLYIDY